MIDNDETEQDVCAYADDAIEGLLKKTMNLEDENRELREQINRLLWIMEDYD